jgi:hypothetical protein
MQITLSDLHYGEFTMVGLRKWPIDRIRLEEADQVRPGRQGGKDDRFVNWLNAVMWEKILRLDSQS